MTAMVKAEGVHKSFGAVEVLKGIDLEVKQGEVFCLIGPSGSGKSTFLRCINHLEKINAGRLYVDGELVGYRQKGDKLYELKDSEVALKRRDIGMVFQRFNLFPHMTAVENVMEAPVQVKGMSRAQARERARGLLERVGLADKAGNYPSQLSGGQQQRVAVARALAAQPEIIFGDEPTGNLDSRAGAEVLGFLRRSVTELGQTIVMVTHDPVAASYADRVLYLADGRIVDEMHKPTAEAVLDRMKDFDARGRTS